MRFTFEVAGQNIINRELLRVGAHAGDVSPALRVIVGVMRDETREQFTSQGGHASGGWSPLAASTLAAKRAAGYRTEILRRTDALMRSLTVENDPNQVVEVGPQSLTFGSRLPYGVFHQTGTSHMPARPPIAFNETAKRRIVKVLQRWIMVGELEAVA